MVVVVVVVYVPLSVGGGMKCMLPKHHTRSTTPHPPTHKHTPRDDMPVVGDIVWTAIVHHRQYTLDRLTNALLARDLLDVAARATCAAVDRGNARDAAVGMTPAIVGAVVAGRGAVVAGVAHKVVGLGYAELLLQLLLSLVHAHHAEALGRLVFGECCIGMFWCVGCGCVGCMCVYYITMYTLLEFIILCAHSCRQIHKNTQKYTQNTQVQCHGTWLTSSMVKHLHS